MHKRLGILGGMTPESTIAYYQHIVRSYQQRFGDHGFPEVVIYSVSFQPIEDWMEAGEWDRIGDTLGQALRAMHQAGVEVAVVATNTMHLLFDRLERESPIPLISIVDATARAIVGAGLRTVGLLGTRFTMEKGFYADGLARHGIATLVPDADERREVHRVIMAELSMGRLEPDSRRRYVEIIEGLAARGAEGVVLGCTEIPLLVGPGDTRVPLFNTTTLHADEALACAIGADPGR
jgi:aspartate racemase